MVPLYALTSGFKLQVIKLILLYTSISEMGVFIFLSDNRKLQSSSSQKSLRPYHKSDSLMAQTPTALFPSIGSVADQTDNLQTRETDDPTFLTLSTNDNEEKVVQEVESLCMKCDEQVSFIFFSLWISN